MLWSCFLQGGKYIPRGYLVSIDIIPKGMASDSYNAHPSHHVDALS